MVLAKRQSLYSLVRKEIEPSRGTDLSLGKREVASKFTRIVSVRQEGLTRRKGILNLHLQK